MTAGIPESYVTLCLQAGVHLEGLVDAYYGPPSLRDEIAAAPSREPAALCDDARALLHDVASADLEDDRVRWLTGQLRALECVTARLAGEDLSWSDEVERCYGIRPQHADESAFRAAHRRLDDALPGRGDVAARYNAWRDESTVPAETLPPAMEAMAGELRRRTRALVDLPRGEDVEWETVAGVPWQAFNWYRGSLRSVVQVNLDLPSSLLDVVEIVAHEAYPGHHTERACKEQLLYEDGARPEMAVMLLAAPEATIAEGIATNALDEAVRDDGLGAVLDVAGDLRVDAEVAAVVHEVEAELGDAAGNAALMLHEEGASRGEAESYLLDWALDSPERAAKTVSFLLDPGSRAYVTTYTDGRRLCRSFVDRTPDGFRRLLTEQLTVSSLLDAGA